GPPPSSPPQPPGRLLRRRDRPTAPRPARRPVRLDPRQRRNRQGLPAPPRRHPHPPPPGRPHQDLPGRPVPLRRGGQGVPHRPKDSFLVANADYVANMTGSDAVGAFLLDTGGASPATVANRVRTQLGPQAQVSDIVTSR